MNPQQGKVSSQAATMLLATSHLTRLGFFEAPTPMMAAVLQCEVETGMPVDGAMKRRDDRRRDAATPWYFSSLTMSIATDL